MKQLELIHKINELFSVFVSQVKGASSSSLYDINIISEYILIPLFKEIFALDDLRNVNSESKNYPGIDLVDDKTGTAFQVTSTSTSRKINDTFTQFFKQGLNKKYNRLYFYILTEKQNSYTIDQVDLRTFKFDFSISRDILDYRSLINIIQGLDIDKIQAIQKILKKQFTLERSIDEDLDLRIWEPVIFRMGRDMGPALLGRSLGPSDAVSCPKIIEANFAIDELKKAFSARIVGEPGAGKTICAFQAAKQFAESGWQVVRLHNPRTKKIDLQDYQIDVPVLFIIDDAHLIPPDILRNAEDQTEKNRLLLSTHNSATGDSSYRNSIVIDARRAVRTIAASLRETPKKTLDVVKRIDDSIGERPMDGDLENRINLAEEKSTVPWQFCFILGGGWRRADVMASAARVAGTDIVLAGISIRQLVSRDENPLLEELTQFIEVANLNPSQIKTGIQWLAKKRFIIGSHDLRCPHQRFASVVLSQILKGQTQAGREKIGLILQNAMMSEVFPISGQRSLLHELRFTGNSYRWAHLIPETALKSVIERCWVAESPEERMYASLLFSELDGYIKNWPEAILIGREKLIGSWISEPLEPIGHGLSNLIHGISNKDKEFSSTIIAFANPIAVAKAISNVSPTTAWHLGELLSALSVTREHPWSKTFSENIEYDNLIDLASDWSPREPTWAFAKFCQAITWVDESLALDMVEQFIPIIQAQLENDPISAFRDIEDITWHVLRMFDPLRVYVGKLAPKKRHRRIATHMLKTINSKKLASQLSKSSLRNFQKTSHLLSFIERTSPAKFNSTVGSMDWDQIAETIGKHWSNLPHDAEVLLGVAYSSKPSREQIQKLIENNLYRIKELPPRIAYMNSSAAFQHVEKGRTIRITQHGHVEWIFGAAVVASFADQRPDLLKELLSPSEIPTGAVLSHAHSSWYKDAYLYVGILGKVVPETLQRILEGVDIKGAEKGWPNALSCGGGSRKTVSLLVESSLNRPDKLGDLAKRLRTRFPKSSIPKKNNELSKLLN